MENAAGFATTVRISSSTCVGFSWFSSSPPNRLLSYNRVRSPNRAVVLRPRFCTACYRSSADTSPCCTAELQPYPAIVADALQRMPSCLRSCPFRGVWLKRAALSADIKLFVHIIFKSFLLGLRPANQMVLYRYFYLRWTVGFSIRLAVAPRHTTALYSSSNRAQARPAGGLTYCRVYPLVDGVQRFVKRGRSQACASLAKICCSTSTSRILWSLPTCQVHLLAGAVFLGSARWKYHQSRLSSCGPASAHSPHCLSESKPIRAVVPSCISGFGSPSVASWQYLDMQALNAARCHGFDNGRVARASYISAGSCSPFAKSQHVTGRHLPTQTAV